MPSEDAVRPQSNRRSSSRRSQYREPLSPPSNTPPQHKRLHKHVVGGHRGGLHSRVPSTQKIKLQHGADGEPMKRASSEYKLPRNGSTTSLKKNLSQVSLKRNKSAAEVRPKSSGPLKKQQSQGTKAAVHFEVGLDGHDDGNEDADGWTEASGSASPVLSRKSSVGGSSTGPNSTRQSANNSQLQSPVKRRSIETTRNGDVPSSPQNERFHTPDAKQITSRLLKRTPSHSAAPKMSSISATANPGSRSPESLSKSQVSTLGSAKDKPEISRFLGSNSGTPSDSPFLSNTAKDNIHSPPNTNGDLNQSKRAKSMGNLVRQHSPSSDEHEVEERALAPRSRKTSATSFNPALSRTQQKQWLQRASSAIEPQQISRDRFSNLPPFGPGTPLLGTSYDGRDPRVRMQLERTGLEYLVVRRYQNPVKAAVKRLDSLPGSEKWVRIPTSGKNKSSAGGKRTRPLSENLGLGVGSLGLSQSFKDSVRHSVNGIGGLRHAQIVGQGESRSSRSTYEGHTSHGHGLGSGGESDLSGSANGDVNRDGDRNGVKETLRSIWEKSFEMSASQD